MTPMKSPRQPTEARIALPKTLPLTGVRLKPARMKKTSTTRPSIMEKLLVTSVTNPITAKSMGHASSRRIGGARGVPSRSSETSNASGVMMLRGSRCVEPMAI